MTPVSSRSRCEESLGRAGTVFISLSAPASVRGVPALPISQTLETN
jgi:hypothetical protein